MNIPTSISFRRVAGLVTAVSALYLAGCGSLRSNRIDENWAPCTVITTRRAPNGALINEIELPAKNYSREEASKQAARKNRSYRKDDNKEGYSAHVHCPSF